MPTPYYEDSAVRLYLGDCREILPALPAVDLVLTDPPYGIFKRTGGDGRMFGKETIYSKDDTAAEWDKRPPSDLLLAVRDAGRLYAIWGGNYFADVLGACPGPLVWDKQTGQNTYADGECAWSNLASTMRIFRHQWCGAFKDSERGLAAVHPTQKPVALMSWCISLAKGAHVVLDPFMGSGTTLRAAKDLGRKAIGIEIEERYCEIAAKRMAQEVLFA